MMIAAEAPEYITVREAAERFGVKVATVRQWIARRRVTVYRQELGQQRIKLDAREIEQKTTPQRFRSAD